MKARMENMPSIQVDMVPLIDIITLILMFLVIVGGISKSSEAVSINLPRADQARKEQELPVHPEGRISISLKSVDGVYYAYLGPAKRYDITSRNTNTISALSTYLLQSAEYQHKRGTCKQLEDGTYNIPVNLRIGEDAPMRAVEDLVAAIADAKLRDIQYAAQPNLEDTKNP